MTTVFQSANHRRQRIREAVLFAFYANGAGRYTAVAYEPL